MKTTHPVQPALTRTMRQPTTHESLTKLEALQLNGEWYVRPEGQLGSCGYYPEAWSLTHVPGARSAQEAVRLAYLYV